MPTETRFGGESALLDLNDNLQGVGYQSTTVNATALSTIEDETTGCSAADVLKDLPFDVCVWNIANSTDLFHLGAVLWQFDNNGDVVSTTALPELVTPNADDTRIYKSYAVAVNNSGTAVGYSYGWFANDVTEPTAFQSRSFYAVIYKDGQVIDITDDHTVEFDSRLYDINNAGIATGHVTKFINGSQRTKFFYIDTTAETPTKVFPTDFFTGSSSTARAINENGMIVGEGEVETQNDQQSTTGASNSRRRHAFMYSISDDKFTDLNDFITCSSPYTIIEARGINDNNEISATALINVPLRDAKGEIMLDSDGNQLMEDVPRAVVLKPTSGEVEDCSATETKVVRQGASFNWLFLAFGFIFAGKRRFFK